MNDDQHKELMTVLRSMAHSLSWIVVWLCLLFMGGCSGCFSITH